MAAAALSDSPLPVEPEEVVPAEVVEVVVPDVAVVDPFAPGVALGDPGVVPVLAFEPAAGVDPDVLEWPGAAGVVPAGLGAGGLLELDDGLGFGDGLGAVGVAAGGGLLGAPPEPNANPITVPGAGL